MAPDQIWQSLTSGAVDKVGDFENLMAFWIGHVGTPAGRSREPTRILCVAARNASSVQAMNRLAVGDDVLLNGTLVGWINAGASDHLVFRGCSFQDKN